MQVARLRLGGGQRVDGQGVVARRAAEQAQRLVGYGPIASADANVFRDLCSFPDWQTSADADADYEFIDAGN